MTSGTRSIVSQRSWICWRVVTSAMSPPDSFVISAEQARPAPRSSTPFGMRTRIMKCPGVGLRMNTPTHFSRSLSSSAIVFQPSRANRMRSSVTSRPSCVGLERLDLVHDGDSAAAQPHRARLQLGLTRERVAGATA